MTSFPVGGLDSVFFDIGLKVSVQSGGMSLHVWQQVNKLVFLTCWAAVSVALASNSAICCLLAFNTAAFSREFLAAVGINNDSI